MEPKSKAFYTAVAISILAVLGATIFPTLVQAVQATTATQTADEDSADQGAAEGGGDEADDGAAEQGQTAQRAADDAQRTADDAQSQQSEDTGSDETTDEGGEANDGPALASSDGMISCGEVVESDVTLQQDLSCPDDGVLIRGEDITFNMNGHSITSSDGDDNSVDLTMDIDGNSGITVSDATGVTILGLGQISDFDNGIKITGSSDVQMSDVTLRDNGIGVLADSSKGVYISKNSIDTNEYGVV